MFGGLAFLIGGNMAIAASGQGGLLVRADPAESDRLVASSSASVAVMRGRPMPGWLRVAVRTGEDEAATSEMGHGRKLLRPLPAAQGSSGPKISTRSKTAAKVARR